MIWSVYDCTADEVIGVWNDVCAAEEFCRENEEADDCWGVFPYDELILEEDILCFS